MKPTSDAGAKRGEGEGLSIADIPDRELVLRFQQGDQTAFDALVLRHQGHVRATCMRFLGRRALAEETAQDVFVSVYRNLHRFRREAQFRTWLHRVVLNHCRNKHAYRTRRHEKKHEPLEGSAPTSERPGRQIASEAEHPDVRIDRSRRLALMRTAMNELNEMQRTLLILRDGEDRSYEEISQLLDLNIGTVKSRIFRARKQLATLVGKRLREGGAP